MPRLLLLVLWLVGSLSFLLWAGTHRFHVGHMLLPRSQAVAIAASIVVVVTLVVCWGWLLLWSVGRRLGVWSGSLLEHRSLRLTILASLLASIVLFGYGRWIEPRWIAVRELSLGEPAGDEEVRIAVISDLHVDTWRRPFSGLAEKVNALRPDLILFLGDTLNRRAALQHLHRVLAPMSAPRGKLAVRGNWDVWYWSRLDLLKGTGFEWLDGERRRLRVRGQELDLVGLPYRDGEGGERARHLLEGSGPGWRIFLYHTPDLVWRVRNADLYLAGHTHGGQIALPFLGALVTLSAYGKQFERGLYEHRGARLYVHPGIGVEPLIPVRLRVRPEVLLLRLGRKPAGPSPSPPAR